MQPVALLIAGLIGPLLNEIYGWRHALVVIGIGCLLFPLILEFMRREFDSDKDVTRQFHLSDFRETIGFVMGKPELRGLAFGSFAFVGLQTTFIAYFVIYLTEIGFSLIVAGTIFSIATAVAIPGRIFWGWLSSRYISPRAMLGFLAILMFLAVSGVALFSPIWADWQVTLVAIVVSASVFSWHGVTLAEAARLAPVSMRGAVTGGVLSFGQCGGLVLPLLYSLVLGVTESYKLGFFICALPAFFVGLLLLYSARHQMTIIRRQPE